MKFTVIDTATNEMLHITTDINIAKTMVAKYAAKGYSTIILISREARIIGKAA